MRAVYTGVVDPEARRLILETIDVRTTPTAKSVTGLRRQVTVNTKESETTLDYTLDMAAVGKELQPHLDASLVKQPEETIDRVTMEELESRNEKESQSTFFPFSPFAHQCIAKRNNNSHNHSLLYPCIGS